MVARGPTQPSTLLDFSSSKSVAVRARPLAGHARRASGSRAWAPASPAISAVAQTGIVGGTHAADLTADRLFQNLELPLDWNEQKALLLDR
jgi:hypothetical protein